MSETPELAPEQAVPAFDVVVRAAGDVVVVELHGELCMRTAPQAEEQLSRLLANGRADIVLDLRGVEFMDSNGVRLLIETDERSRAEKFDFAIVLDSNQPSRVLELVGLVDRPRRVAPEDLPAAS
jgi:anti-sigma B factor antagonist